MLKGSEKSSLSTAWGVTQAVEPGADVEGPLLEQGLAEASSGPYRKATKIGF